MPRTAEPWKVVVEKRSNGAERFRLIWRDTRGRRRRSDLPDAMTMAQAVKQGRRKFGELVAADAVAPRATAGRQRITLGRWFERFLHLKRRKLDSRSLQAYRESVNRAIAFMGDWGLDRYAREHCDDWLAAMEVEGLSASTVSKHARHLRAVFKLAMLYGHVADCPVYVPTPPKRVRGAYIARETLDRIWEACPHDGWRCLFGLSRLAGLRANEMFALTWADVDWERRLLLLRPVKETTKKSVRDVPIVPALYELLQRTFEQAQVGTRGPLHGVSDKTLYRRNPTKVVSVHVILRRAGVTGYHKPLHDLRGSCERDWVSQGHSWPTVCYWLGHSPTVAMDHYLEPTPADIQKATGPREAKDTEMESLRATNQRMAMELEQLRAALGGASRAVLAPSAPSSA